MDVELIEIHEFLAKHPPFEQLPAEALEQLPRQLIVRYLRRGSAFPPQDDQAAHLYILRRGAIELRDGAGELAGKLAEGDLFSDVCIRNGSERGLCGETAEDSLLYSLTCAALRALMLRPSRVRRVL